MKWGLNLSGGVKDMNKQELLKELKVTRDSYDNEDEFLSGVRTGLSMAIFDAEQLDEPEKVVVPKFVANYIELCKGENGDRQAYTEDNSGLWFALNGDSQGMPNSVSDWLFNEEKVETFARAWLDGYETEKEKLYYVLDKQGKTLLVLMGGEVRISGGYVLSESTANKDIYQLTENQIKDYDERFWQFAVEASE